MDETLKNIVVFVYNAHAWLWLWKHAKTKTALNWTDFFAFTFSTRGSNIKSCLNY